MDSIETFMIQKHAADEKWKANGNLTTIKLIRALVILLLLSAPVTVYLTFTSPPSTYLMWMITTFLIFVMLYVIHKIFEKLVDIRRINEKRRDSTTN